METIRDKSLLFHLKSLIAEAAPLDLTVCEWESSVLKVNV